MATTTNNNAQLKRSFETAEGGIKKCEHQPSAEEGGILRRYRREKKRKDGVERSTPRGKLGGDKKSKHDHKIEKGSVIDEMGDQKLTPEKKNLYC